MLMPTLLDDGMKHIRICVSLCYRVQAIFSLIVLALSFGRAVCNHRLLFLQQKLSYLPSPSACERLFLCVVLLKNFANSVALPR